MTLAGAFWTSGLTHLQFDEQWTYVAKKQARLTTDQRADRHDIGDVYLWTCVDQKTKLMPSFLIGKRSADNARRFGLPAVAVRTPIGLLTLRSIEHQVRFAQKVLERSASLQLRAGSV